MLLGKPKNLNNYICISSKISIELHKIGFIPVYREIDEDKIYYIKTQELCEVVNRLWNLNI